MADKKRPTHCKLCGKKGTARNPVSFRAKCAKCAEAAIRANNEQMSAKDGPAYEAWRKAMRRASKL